MFAEIVSGEDYVRTKSKTTLAQSNTEIEYQKELAGIRLRINLHLKKYRMTIRRLAEESDLDYFTVWRFVTGHTQRPQDKTVRAIEGVMNASVLAPPLTQRPPSAIRRPVKPAVPHRQQEREKRRQIRRLSRKWA